MSKIKHLTIDWTRRSVIYKLSASTEAFKFEITQRSLGRARSNLLGLGNGTSNLSAVVLGFADVVGDVVGKHHLVTVDNLDRFVVGDVFDTLGGGSRNLSARLHGHGLSKSSDDLEPVLVLHAFVLAGRLSGSPDVVVLSSSSSLEVEGMLSELVDLSHGDLTLHDEVEGLDLSHASGGSSAPVSASSSHSGLAALERVLAPKSMKVLLSSLALGKIELLVSDSMLESDLHDVVMDSSSDGLGLEESGSLGSSFTGSLGGSSELGSDGSVSVSSGDVSLSETESSITFGTSSSSLGSGNKLSEVDSLLDGSSSLLSGLTDSESVSSDLTSVGNLRSNSSSNGSTHGLLADSNVRGNPFVESNLLESKSLLSFSLGNTSSSNSSSDRGLSKEEDSLHGNVFSISSLLGSNSSSENGMRVNSSTDSDSKLADSSLASVDSDLKSELGSLESSGMLLSNLLGLLKVVSNLISILAGLDGVEMHVSSSDNPHLSEGSHTLSHLGGLSSSGLVVEVELDSSLSDDEHLSSPSDSGLHLELGLSGDSLSVLSSDESSGSTSNGLTHSLLSLDSRSVSLLGLDNLNVSEVDGNLKSSVSDLDISLSADSLGVHLLGSSIHG